MSHAFDAGGRRQRVAANVRAHRRRTKEAALMVAVAALKGRADGGTLQQWKLLLDKFVGKVDKPDRPPQLSAGLRRLMRSAADDEGADYDGDEGTRGQRHIDPGRVARKVGDRRAYGAWLTMMGNRKG